MADPSLADPIRESGYWFELQAIRDKFTFSSLDLDVDGLITAIEEGLSAGRVPALTPVQISKFSRFLAQPNVELAFDYEPVKHFCC